MILCVCADCEFEQPAPADQTGSGPTPPRAGDFWLCSRCGLIHRFRLMFVPIPDSDEGELALATTPAYGEELQLLPQAHRRQMLAHQERILSARPQA